MKNNNIKVFTSLLTMLLAIIVCVAGCSKETNNGNNDDSSSIVSEETTDSDEQTSEDDGDQEDKSEEFSSIEFSDTQLFAIVDASSGGTSDIIAEYLNDVTAISEVNLGADEQRYVIIPKNREVKFSVYKTELSEDGTIKAGEQVAEDKIEALVIKSECIEYIPKFRIVAIYGDETVEFDLTYSGEDGSIVNNQKDKVLLIH